MNNVQKFINQQVGFGKWSKCDSSLQYLRCTKDENFNYILPYEEERYHGNLDPPIFACKFAQKEGYEHILALANEDGKIAIHNTDKKESRYGILGHHNAIFDLAWMFKQMKLVSVSGDHSARLFDVTNSSIVEQQVFNGHTRSVKTVTFRQNDYSGFATGGRDGSIFVWDARMKYPSSEIVVPDDRVHNAHRFTRTPSSNKKKKTAYDNSAVSGANSVTGLVYQDDNTLISCGAGDGIIKVWDMRKTYSVHKRDPIPKCTLPYAGPSARNGFSNLILDSSCLKLYANCLDNTIYCYNVGTYQSEPVMKYIGLQNSTFYVKSSLSKDGNYLISGSSDHHAYIWNTSHSLPILSLTGHQAEVTCVAWCHQGEPLVVTCSDDLNHKIWRIGTEILPDNWEVDGRGTTQTYPRQILAKTPKPKRSLVVLLENDVSVYYSRWKHRKIWVNCSCGITNLVNPNNYICRQCGKETNLKRSADDCSSEKKRFRTDKGPKRLFSPIDQNIPSTSYSDNNLESILETDETDKQLASITNSLQKNTIQNNKENDVIVSLNKSEGCVSSKTIDSQFDIVNSTEEALSPEANCKTTTALKEHVSTTFGADFCSVTGNLPNFALDGCAPHVNVSPMKYKDKDWLTKLRLEKSTTKEPILPSPPKIPKLDSSASPKSVKSRSNNNSTIRSPLLKFFRITNSSSVNSNQQCTLKSPNVSSLTQQTQAPL